MNVPEQRCIAKQTHHIRFVVVLFASDSFCGTETLSMILAFTLFFPLQFFPLQSRTYVGSFQGSLKSQGTATSPLMRISKQHFAEPSTAHFLCVPFWPFGLRLSWGGFKCGSNPTRTGSKPPSCDKKPNTAAWYPSQLTQDRGVFLFLPIEVHSELLHCSSTPDRNHVSCHKGLKQHAQGPLLSN